MKEKSCAFTGHRLLGDDFDPALLDRVVERLLKTGIDTFYCGMAKGFDMTAAETVLRYKDKYGARLVCCIPYSGQAECFSAADKERYANILARCESKIVFSQTYNRWCMHARDRYMAENCATVVCYLRKTAGGTHYTVAYARSLGDKIIEI